MSRPLKLLDVPDPSPKPGEILIRVRACGVCRTDLHIIEGELPARKSPVIPGHQIVGEVVRGGEGFRAGERVGAGWLSSTCGGCRFCRDGRENLCEQAGFTGWTRDGGYAEYCPIPAGFVYRLPQGLSDLEAAPLLCAGIIGYRCLKQTDIGDWKGARLGLYGFGAAGHIAVQVASARGAEVYVLTRSPDHQALALELGAAWAGGTSGPPPVRLDAAVVFGPAGELVREGLKALDRGGRLVLGGIHMSPIPPLEYELLYPGRSIVNAANNTRDDAWEFLAEAARVRVRTRVQTFPLDEAHEALLALKESRVRGAAVLQVSS